MERESKWLRVWKKKRKWNDNDVILSSMSTRNFIFVFIFSCVCADVSVVGVCYTNLVHLFVYKMIWSAGWSVWGAKFSVCMYTFLHQTLKLTLLLSVSVSFSFFPHTHTHTHSIHSFVYFMMWIMWETWYYVCVEQQNCRALYTIFCYTYINSICSVHIFPY